MTWNNLESNLETPGMTWNDLESNLETPGNMWKLSGLYLELPWITWNYLEFLVETVEVQSTVVGPHSLCSDHSLIFLMLDL